MKVKDKLLLVNFCDTTRDRKLHRVRRADIGQHPHAVPLNKVEMARKRIGLRHIYRNIFLQIELLQVLLRNEAHLPHVGLGNAHQHRLREFPLAAGKGLKEILDRGIDQLDAGRPLEYRLGELDDAADDPRGRDISYQQRNADKCFKSEELRYLPVADDKKGNVKNENE